MSDINGIVGVVKLKLRANIRDEQIESGRGREWEEVEVKQAKKNSEPELSWAWSEFSKSSPGQAWAFKIGPMNFLCGLFSTSLGLGGFIMILYCEFQT